jgi:predicted aspartyl protease/Flp pilus assembly protein TadD
MKPRTWSVLVVGLILVLSVGLLASKDKLSPATATVQITLADILYDQADYRAAMHLYLRATDCEEPSVRDRARAGTVRAALRIAEFGMAATHVAALRTSSPTDPATLALAGDALWASGRFDEAESAYHDALSVEPGNGRALQGVAKSLASRNQLDQALDQIQAALGRTPNDADLQQTLGSIYERMHRYPEAATAFSKFIGALKGGNVKERAKWARNHIDFLRSFDGMVPIEVSSRDGSRRHVVDFKLVNGKVIIKAKLNGGRSMDMALDTGAEYTALSERTARRLGLGTWTETLSAGVGYAGLRGLGVAKLNSIEIGSLTVRNVPCLIKSPALYGLPVDQTEGFSPIALGLSMTVDYKNRRLTLGEPAPDESPAREIPLRFTRLVTVRGEVDGRPVSFIVDTGGEAISVNASIARGIFTPADRHRIKLQVYGASGLDPDAYLLPGVDLAFGSLKMTNQPVVVLDLRAPSVLLGYEIGGIIGYRLLGKYRVDFDLQKSVLRLRDL